MGNRMTALTLTKFLTQIAADQPAVAASVRALAGVAVELSTTIARPDSTAQLGAVRGSANADGDDQKKLERTISSQVLILCDADLNADSDCNEDILIQEWTRAED